MRRPKGQERLALSDPLLGGGAQNLQHAANLWLSCGGNLLTHQRNRAGNLAVDIQTGLVAFGD